ncbi:hypothetical protein Q7O_000668 [Pectobacterium carotovorum subsp. carotovorum PCCS1]|nr:hypothetical protein [Pectobacterium carotovorum subsp. carotovorum PCCS1]
MYLLVVRFNTFQISLGMNIYNVYQWFFIDSMVMIHSKLILIF